MQGEVIIILVLVASFAGTLTGFGTSTILVPFISLSYPLPETLLFVGIIHLFGDIWKMVFFKKGVRWKLILLFGIPGIAFSYFASRLPVNIPEPNLRRMLGIFLVLYVVFLFIKSKWKLRQNDFNALVGGGLSGFFAGLFGVGGAVRGAFLTTFNLKKEVYIFTSGTIGLLIDTSRLIGYTKSGIRLASYNFTLLFVSILISFLGAYLARFAVGKIPQSKFRVVTAFGLVVVGIYYLL